MKEMRKASYPSSAEEGSFPLQQTLSAKPLAEENPPELLDALRRYEELYDLAPVCFFTLDRRSKILSLNKPASRLLGFPTQWLRERPFLVFISRQDVRRFVSLLIRLRRIPQYQEIFEIDLSINNRRVPVQVSMRSSTNGTDTIYRLAVVDLTESKFVETELKDTLNKWYSLVESAADIIMTVDREAKITFVNRDAWGYGKRGLIGTLLTDHVSVRDQAKIGKCIAAAFAPSDHPATCELSGLNNEDSRWYSFSFGPVRSASATTTVTIRDITEHKRAEESLRASRERLREFAGRLEQVREEERMRVAREIHDELGQALTIFKMDLAWLQSKTKDAVVARKKIKTMIRDVDQTIERVRKIVSELRPSILDEMGLTAALEWQVAQFQQRTGIRGVFEAGSEDLNLRPDRAAALFRVVQEALTNVVRHSGARNVRVAVKPVKAFFESPSLMTGRALPRSGSTTGDLLV